MSDKKTIVSAVSVCITRIGRHGRYELVLMAKVCRVDSERSCYGGFIDTVHGLSLSTTP